MSGKCGVTSIAGLFVAVWELVILRFWDFVCFIDIDSLS